MAKKNKLSTEELITNKENELAMESRRMPKYVTKKLDFYCPLSPHIMWHRGLQYSACPIAEYERDMPSCSKCIYKSNKVQEKSSKKSKPIRRKKSPSIERKSKGPIPKIGKTYHSK